MRSIQFPRLSHPPITSTTVVCARSHTHTHAHTPTWIHSIPGDIKITFSRWCHINFSQTFVCWPAASALPNFLKQKHIQELYPSLLNESLWKGSLKTFIFNKIPRNYGASLGMVNHSYIVCKNSLFLLPMSKLTCPVPDRTNVSKETISNC